MKKVKIVMRPIFILALSIAMLKGFANGVSNSLQFYDDALPQDSTQFLSNIMDGWKNYNTYLSATGDSVALEIIPYKEKTQGNNWTFPFLIGKVTDTQYLPSAEVTVNCSEPNRKWALIIKMDGSCLLWLASGTPPTGNTVVIPIKTRYKK